MDDRLRLITFAIVIMAAVSLVVAGTTMWVLYAAAFSEDEARLVESVKSQARLIEAIARHAGTGGTGGQSGSAEEATLGPLLDAHKNYQGFGETGEFALARRDGDSIRFLLSHRHYDLDSPKPVPFDSELAEPMRLALQGRSGTVVGRDYRGTRVLAAYEPVAGLNWGIVAKIDLCEIRTPFVRAGTVAGSFAVLLILLGAAFSVRVSNPLLRRLEESEAQFRDLYESAPLAYLSVAVDGRIRTANQGAADLLGYERNELIGRPVFDLFENSSTAEDHHLRLTEELVEGKEACHAELEMIRKDTSSVWAGVTLRPLRDPQGRVAEWRLVARDVTEQKRAERVVRESEHRLSSILDSAIDPIVAINEQQVVRLFNEAAEQTFGCKAAEAIGRPFARFATEPLRRLLARCVERFGRDGDPAKQFVAASEGLTAIRADGREFRIEAKLSQTEAAGEKLCTIMLHDVDERTRAEQELRRLETENIYLREQSDIEFEEIVGSSSAIRNVLDRVRQVAASDATVLVTGETGTGKQLVATAIHNLSPRKDRIFVTVNCAGLASGLIESELFGHEKGAFTGALSRKIGRFEMADGGTIFLDEIGEMPPELQAKLLRALQQGEFERVGSSESRKVDVRVVAATNRDLEKEVSAKRFRADLYYRLNVFPIHIPPLRQRPDDIGPLVQHFAIKFAAKTGKKIDSIPQTTMDALVAYPWPGNVRELENVIERAAILTHGPELELGSLPSPPLSEGARAVLLTLEEVERRHIVAVLEKTSWRVSGPRGAAKILGLKPTTLEARMKKLGITRKP